MKTQLRKVGNSIGSIIPAAMARELLLTAGSEVDIELKAGAIVLTPLKRGSKRLPYTEAQFQCFKSFLKVLKVISHPD